MSLSLDIHKGSCFNRCIDLIRPRASLSVALKQTRINQNSQIASINWLATKVMLELDMSSTKTESLHFQIDPSEAVHGSDFLTPLYFNRQVLTRYLYDSRFRCDFASETYGTIYGEEFTLSFGLNKNGTVIAWLGDIQDLPIRERFYWLVENKSPEREIASEFFDSQIDVQFTPPPAVIQCLNKLEEFNKKFHAKFGVYLYHEKSIEERIEETRRYKRLLLNNLDDFKRFTSEFNEVIVENTNNSEIRRLLAENSVAVDKGLKGNKLLQSVYEKILKDEENLIAPFFYLYDLRLWADHSMGDDKLNAVAKNLSVSPSNCQGLMEALVARLDEAITQLLRKLEDQPTP